MRFIRRGGVRGGFVFAVLFLASSAAAQPDRTPPPPPETPPALSGTSATALTDELAGLSVGERRLALTLYFASGQNALTLAQAEQLRLVQRALIGAGADGFAVRTRGFTDDVGDAAFNLALSQTRADTVLGILVTGVLAGGGLQPAATGAVGFGERHAREKTGTAIAERAAERRVEVLVRRVGASTVPTPPRLPEPPPGGTAEADPATPPAERETAPAGAETLVFTALSGDVALSAPDGRLAMSPSGTVEFWVAPGWTDEAALAYDPVVLAVGDGRRTRLAVAIDRERKALLLWNGTTDTPVGVPADFTDGRLRHVAVALEAGRATVFVDGFAKPGPFPFLMGEAGASRLDIAGTRAGTLAFVGRLARLRFWQGALDAADVERLMTTAGALSVADPLYGAFLGGVAPGEDGEAAFDAVDRAIPLAGAFFAPFGATELGLGNRAALAARPEAPVLRSLLDPGAGYRGEELDDLLETIEGNRAFGVPAARAIRDHERIHAAALDHVEAASYPLVRVERVAAVDPADLTIAPPDPAAGHLEASFEVPIGRVRVFTGTGDRIVGIEVERWRCREDCTALLGARKAVGHDGTTAGTVEEIALADGEEVVRIEGRRNGRRLVQLTLVTTGAIHGPFGGDHGERFSVTLSPDAPFRGVGAPPGDLAALSFVEPAPPDDIAIFRRPIEEIEVWSGARVEGFRVYADSPASAARSFGVLGRTGAGERATVALGEDEALLAVTGRRSPDGLTDVRFFTTKAVHGPFGTGRGGEPFALRLPAGVPFTGVFARGGRLADLAVEADHAVLGPGLLLTFEDGRAARFVRTGRNTFEAVSPHLPIPGYRRPAEDDGTPRRRPPTLEIVAPDRIRIEGLARDLVLVGAHDPPARQTRFDDTFVSLSKAVNLQANYGGYDIARMDPIHLTDTGVGGEIFRMPDGDSGDYHDFNRIFVPNGLVYTPLFTGQASNHTTTSTSLSQYKDTFRRTVGGNLSGKLAPASFALSNTVEHVRGSFSRTETVRTTGLSQIFFYALSIDKARIDLSPSFRDGVAALEETGDYEAFIDAFGTHYAGTVFYGGMGVLDMEANTTETGTSSSDLETFSVKAGALLDKATGSALSYDYSTTTGTEQEARETFGEQVENFYWVGGTHMGADRQNWSVGPDGAVPVHVDLRPIDDLLTPFFFEEAEITQRVRQELAAAVDERLARVAAIERYLAAPPHVFELAVTGLACQNSTSSWSGQYLWPNDVAFKATPAGADRPVETAGSLADGVEPTKRFTGPGSTAFELRRGLELDDVCVSPEHHGRDFLADVLPEAAMRRGTFTFDLSDLQGAELALAVYLEGYSGFIGTPDPHPIAGEERIRVRRVLCQPREVDSPTDCRFDLEDAPRTVSGHFLVRESGGTGVLRIDYDLTHKGMAQ